MCYYQLFDTLSTFDEAFNFCRDMNTDVASIYSVAENAVVDSLRQGGFKDGIWLGGQRLGADSFGWVNSRGSVDAMTYQNYMAGEPNNFKNEENCLAMGHKVMMPDAAWNDVKCWSSKAFVCKFCIDAADVEPSTTSSSSTSSSSTTSSAETTSTSSTSTTSSSTETTDEPTPATEIGVPQPGTRG